MIESLNGIFETINNKQSTSIKLYDNDEYEDYPAPGTRPRKSSCQQKTSIP